MGLRRITGEELAFRATFERAKLRKPQSFIANYEGGERRVDVIEFIAICRAIGTNPVKLIRTLAA